MSKIYEAIQRLERESGQVLPGVSAAAQQVLQKTVPLSQPADTVQDGNHETQKPVEIPVVRPATGDGSESPFGLKQIPIENAVIRPESRIVYHTHPDSAGADRFRLLRMHLWPLWESGKLKTFFVTSAFPQDGKSTIVLNLATALAERGQRSVLVIEADLCHPVIASRLGLERGPGLAECVEAARNPLSLVSRIEPLGWYLLRAGGAEGNPTEVLQSPVLASVFAAIRPHFDWIIMDTPPVMPLTDTLSLRQYADAGLLVVREGQTPRDAVETAISLVGSKHLLGLLLNASEEFERAYSAYHRAYGGVRKSKS